MGRLSSGINHKLIKTGIKLARSRGLGGFSVRELCALANVNLGMFHYYFGSKENFDKAVLEALYDELMQNINPQAAPGRSTRDNVENIMKSIHLFIYTNRVLLSALAGDVFGGNEKIMRFILEHFTTHISILKTELLRAKKEGLLRDSDIANNILVLMSSVILPQLATGLLDRFKEPVPLHVKTVAAQVGSGQAAYKRIRILLKAVFKE